MPGAGGEAAGGVSLPEDHGLRRSAQTLRQSAGGGQKPLPGLPFQNHKNLFHGAASLSRMARAPSSGENSLRGVRRPLSAV